MVVARVTPSVPPTVALLFTVRLSVVVLPATTPPSRLADPGHAQRAPAGGVARSATGSAHPSCSSLSRADIAVLVDALVVVTPIGRRRWRCWSRPPSSASPLQWC